MRLGASFIDTADYYENAPEYGSKTNQQGGSETVIGLALKEVTPSPSPTPTTQLSACRCWSLGPFGLPAGC